MTPGENSRPRANSHDDKASITSKLTTLGLIAVALLSMGLRCPPPGTTTLKAIKDDPRRFEGKIVTVYGEVTERMSLVAVSYFKLYDRSDEEIFVVTRRTLPTVGSKVRVRGKVQPFSILNWQGLVIFELPK